MNKQAFPGLRIQERMYGMGPREVHEEGMSLRDYFAAKAMQTLLNNYNFGKDGKAARHCYEIADVMLEAREER